MSLTTSKPLSLEVSAVYLSHPTIEEADGRNLDLDKIWDHVTVRVGH